MTKRDYVLIAEVIREEASGWNADSLVARAIDSLAKKMAERLEAENSQFNRERFIKAASV